MIRIGVLISGSGTNLQAIIDAIAERRLDAEIAVVLSNVPTASGLDRAKRANIPTRVVDHREFTDRKSFDKKLVEVLTEARVDCVALAGFMRLLTPAFLDAFPMRVVNIHPSLLPSFPGVDAQAQALRYGVRVTGCTVHFVDGGTDTGPIIAQTAVPVRSDDDEGKLRERILRAEHALFPQVLQWMSEGRVHVESVAGGRARVGVDGVEAGEER